MWTLIPRDHYHCLCVFHLDVSPCSATRSSISSFLGLSWDSFEVSIKKERQSCRMIFELATFVQHCISKKYSFMKFTILINSRWITNGLNFNLIKIINNAILDTSFRIVVYFVYTDRDERLIACTTFSMSNGTNGETLTRNNERLLYRNDVCLTDCVFLCILSAAFGILWLDLDLWCKSQLYF